MNYDPILKKLFYWRNYSGSGDKYRQEHDLDCILTNGDLWADTLFSLWLPLRYTLNWFEAPRWEWWKDFEFNCLKKKGICLKNYNPFIMELESNIQSFLPEDQITKKLVQFFALGQERFNVIVLPQQHRDWNVRRGSAPYYDYMPHFLYDLFDTYDYETLVSWVEKERLDCLFYDKIIDKDHIANLAGTGNVCLHSPREISLPTLLDNYVEILKQRKKSLCGHNENQMNKGTYLLLKLNDKAKEFINNMQRGMLQNGSTF